MLPMGPIGRAWSETAPTNSATFIAPTGEDSWTTPRITGHGALVISWSDASNAGGAVLVLRDSPSCVPLPGVVAGLASVDVCHNAGQCRAGERFALLAVVANFLRVVSTYNRQQWHTHCLGMPLAIGKLTINAR